VAVAGQSCGGLETYQMRDDPRVGYLGIFSSGFLDSSGIDGMPDEGPDTIQEVNWPVCYFLGGTTDIAYANVRPPPRVFLTLIGELKSG
jgi:hypothetical protein